MTDATPPPSAVDRSARACYQALHRAFDATLAGMAGQPQGLQALMSQVFDSFAGNLTLQCEDEAPLACQRGCATCCTLRVGATAPEVWWIARFLRAVTPRLEARGIDLIGRLRAADARTRGLGEADRMAAQQPCAFIAQGVCVIYAVRPLACRGHASHDVTACVDAAAGRREQVPYSVGHRMVRSLVQNALQSALRDAGLAWQVYELNQALLLGCDLPQAERAWHAGVDVLAAASIDDVPRAEMAAVFDRLRP